MRYDVLYSLDGVRDFKDFSTKKQAMKFVFEMKAKGAEKMFIDTYDEEGNLLDYKVIEEGAWIRHKKPSKFSGTLAFNKADQDSIANKHNRSIVPFKGINHNWGICK